MQTMLHQPNNYEIEIFFESQTFNLDLQLPNNITFQINVSQNLEILTQLDLILKQTNQNQNTIFNLNSLQYI